MRQPSESHVSLSTGDPQEFQSVITANLRPAFILARPREKQSFRFRQVRLRRSYISLFHGDHGFDIRLSVDPGRDHAYIFWVQLEGTSWMSPDGKEYFAIPQFHGCIAGDNSEGFIRQSPHSRQFFIRFDRALVHDNCEDGDSLLSMLDREMPVRLASLLGSPLQRFIHYVIPEFGAWNSSLHEPKTAQRTEQLLIALLTSRIGRGEPGSAWPEPEPEFVTRAERYILDHIGEEITMDDLVAAAGVSMRTLYRGFRRCKGLGPMAFVRDRQLEKARAVLLESDPGSISVTEVAFGLGFHHLSHFAALYRNRFGCLPSDTLLRKM